MKAVIDWMVDRDLVEGLGKIKLLRRAFGDMSYDEFGALGTEYLVQCLERAKIEADADTDSIELAVAIGRGVVGKTITSLIEAGHLRGGQASELRKQVTTMTADAVLSLDAEPNTPLHVLQTALTAGELVTAPLTDRPGMGGAPGTTIVVTGDRAVGRAVNTGIITTGDNSIIHD